MCWLILNYYNLIDLNKIDRLVNKIMGNTIYLLTSKATWRDLKMKLAISVANRLNITLGMKGWFQCVYNIYVNVCVNMKRLQLGMYICVYVMRYVMY